MNLLPLKLLLLMFFNASTNKGIDFITTCNIPSTKVHNAFIIIGAATINAPDIAISPAANATEDTVITPTNMDNATANNNTAAENIIIATENASNAAVAPVAFNPNAAKPRTTNVTAKAPKAIPIVFIGILPNANRPKLNNIILLDKITSAPLIAIIDIALVPVAFKPLSINAITAMVSVIAPKDEIIFIHGILPNTNIARPNDAKPIESGINIQTNLFILLTLGLVNCLPKTLFMITKVPRTPINVTMVLPIEGQPFKSNNQH